MHRGQKDLRTRKAMRRGAAVQAKRRGGVEQHWIVGGFRMAAGHVFLVAVATDPAFLVTGLTLTSEVRYWARWRTKQGAWKWLKERPLLRHLRVIDDLRLDILDLGTDTGLRLVNTPAKPA